MSDRFQQFVGASRPPQLVKPDELPDDEAFPAVYQAVRRIRSFRFADVVFRRHGGSAQGFPWHNLRSWMVDETRQHLVFLWPEAMVTLTGRGFAALEEDVMRRIVAEFREVAPQVASTVPGDQPIIVAIDIRPVDPGNPAPAA